MAVPQTSGEKTTLTPTRKKNFLAEVLYELKNVTWPTPQEAWRLTMVVLAVIVSMAIYMGIIDALLSTAVSRLHLIK